MHMAHRVCGARVLDAVQTSVLALVTALLLLLPSSPPPPRPPLFPPKDPPLAPPLYCTSPPSDPPPHHVWVSVLEGLGMCARRGKAAGGLPYRVEVKLYLECGCVTVLLLAGLLVLRNGQVGGYAGGTGYRHKRNVIL